MTDPARHPAEDPVTRRVQEAFAHLEPSVELDELVARATPYLRGMARPARRDRQATSRERAVEQPRGRPAAVRPAPTASAAAGEVDPAVGVPAGRPAAARRRTREVVVVGGVELSAADLAAARRRDSAAVARIYQAYTPALLRFFTAAVGDRRAAEDLTGTVFAAAVEGLPGFRGEVTKLGGWLFRIARHDLYDYRRRAARARTESLDDVLDEATLAADAPGPQVRSGRLEGNRVVAALNQLSRDQREVLLLRLAAGLTISEVAASLGKTTGAVKALQHRGLTTLARTLDLPAAGQRQDDAARRDDEQHADHSGPPERSDTAS